MSNRYGFDAAPRSHVWRVLLLLTAFIVIPMAHSAETLSPFTATYVLKRAGMSVGEVQRKLELRDDGTLMFSAESRSIGLVSWFIRAKVTEQSLFRFDDQGRMQPLEYQYLRSGGKRERRARLTFDWVKGTVVNEIDDDAWTMPIPDNAQDKLLYQLALMRDLQTGATSFDYDIADGGLLKIYHFDVVREEEIVTNLGLVQTRVVERRRDDKVTTLWCAPRWHYLPVRIEQNEQDGDRFQLYLEAFTGFAIDPP